MKYNVKKLSVGHCHITLVPENDIEKKLVIIKDDKDKEDKAYTFRVHYQNAITSKIGLKAHLNSIDGDSYPTTVFAEYILEDGSIGNR
ncbi:MAG: hypothetical protein V4708_03070 [Bacteroidota bacterium]